MPRQVRGGAYQQRSRLRAAERCKPVGVLHRISSTEMPEKDADIRRQPPHGVKKLRGSLRIGEEQSRRQPGRHVPARQAQGVTELAVCSVFMLHRAHA